MSTSFDPQDIRKQFPFFTHNPDWAYLDSAATALKPRSVIEAEVAYYERYSANIKRGVYRLADEATELYETTRCDVAEFLGSTDAREIVFTRNTTESINLLMYALGTDLVRPGDEMVTTLMEHHSNFVPWQQLAIAQNARLTVIDVDEAGELDIPRDSKNRFELSGVVTKRTKLMAITHMSNVLGTINPLKEIIHAARQINPKIIVVVDGAQAVSHVSVDVVDLDCDFYAFSGHKLFGPTGVGVLWGKTQLFESMKPFQYGGSMIDEVSLERSTFASSPERFEAGTPAIAQVIGLGAAIKFVQALSPDVHQHVARLTTQLTKQLESFGAQVFASNASCQTGGVVSFALSGVHPHDLASVCDQSNIAVRAGHHCTMPLHTRLGVSATTRASLHVYNSLSDIERLVTAVQSAINMFK